MVKTHC